MFEAPIRRVIAPAFWRKWELDWHSTGFENFVSSSGPSPVPKKVFTVGEALAETQDLASGVAHTTRIYCVHAPYLSQAPRVTLA